MQNATPFETYEILKHDPAAVLVDVREPEEVAEISVPDAKLIPLGELSDRLSELAGYSHIFFLCRSGGRSARAALFAESEGVKNIHNVTGGIMSWEMAGLPTTKKHPAQ